MKKALVTVLIGDRYIREWETCNDVALVMPHGKDIMEIRVA
jgi:hypothetical protein